MITKEQIYDKAIKAFGTKRQIYKAVEELNELSVELMHYSFNKGDVRQLCEEIADVEIMLEQLNIIFRSHKQTIASIKKDKLVRLEALVNDNK